MGINDDVSWKNRKINKIEINGFVIMLGGRVVFFEKTSLWQTFCLMRKTFVQNCFWLSENLWFNEENCLFYMSLFQKFGATNCGEKTPIDKNPPRRRERDLKIRKNEKRIR